VALGQVFSEYFGFPCQFTFHRLLHIHHLSSGAGRIGQSVADVPSGLSLTPPQETKKKASHIKCLASLNSRTELKAVDTEKACDTLFSTSKKKYIKDIKCARFPTIQDGSHLPHTYFQLCSPYSNSHHSTDEKLCSFARADSGGRVGRFSCQVGPA
jgi:hypothetical protein